MLCAKGPKIISMDPNQQESAKPLSQDSRIAPDALRKEPFGIPLNSQNDARIQIEASFAHFHLGPRKGLKLFHGHT